MFAISHFGLTDYYGRFEKASGTLNFVPGAPEKSALSVKIDMSSLNVPSPELITELAAANVFDSAKFPEATFIAKGIARTGANTGQMTGDLTLHGVTKPVTFDVTFNGGEASPMSPTTYLLGFHATTAIKRSDFGLDKPMWSSMVGADVKLSIDVLFQKQKS
jgi:polyisoprenoid-binding protein YceI